MPAKGIDAITQYGIDKAKKSIEADIRRQSENRSLSGKLTAEESPLESDRKRKLQQTAQ